MKKQEINDLNALIELHYLMKDKLPQKSLHSLCYFFVKDNKMESYITHSIPKEKTNNYSFDINERNVLLYFFNNDFYLFKKIVDNFKIDLNQIKKYNDEVSYFWNNILFDDGSHDIKITEKIKYLMNKLNMNGYIYFNNTDYFPPEIPTFNFLEKLNISNKTNDKIKISDLLKFLNISELIDSRKYYEVKNSYSDEDFDILDNIVKKSNNIIFDSKELFKIWLVENFKIKSVLYNPKCLDYIINNDDLIFNNKKLIKNLEKNKMCLSDQRLFTDPLLFEHLLKNNSINLSEFIKNFGTTPENDDFKINGKKSDRMSSLSYDEKCSAFADFLINFVNTCDIGKLNKDFLFNIKEMVVNTSEKYFKKFEFENLIPALEKRLIFDNINFNYIIEKDILKKRI